MKLKAIMHTVLALVLAVAVPCGNRAAALSIEQVTSGRGLTAWLAQDHHSSIVALRIAFIGGTAAEPRRQAGLTRVLARLLAQGGGHGDRQSFQKTAQRIGLRINFQAGRDALYGSIDVPAPQLASARRLLAEVFKCPTGDAKAVADARALVAAAISEAAADPRAIASDAWFAHAFTGHGYANPGGGDAQVVAAATPGAVASLCTRLLARHKVVIAAAGSLSAGELSSLLDAMLGELSDGDVDEPATPRFVSGPDVRIDWDTDAASIVFGFPAVPPRHPDFSAVRVLAHIIGSGDLDSRLIEELRLRRGLAYSAQLGPVHDRLASMMLGEIVTSPDRAAAALAGLRAVVEGVRGGDVSEEETNRAKLALAGSDLVSLDSNGQIADAMLGVRLDGEGGNFLERRSADLRAVTAEQVRRIAVQLLAPANLLVAVVTRPGR